MIMIMMGCSFKSQDAINLNTFGKMVQHSKFNSIDAEKLVHRYIDLRIFMSMVFIKMLQTRRAINASRAMRNNLV